MAETNLEFSKIVATPTLSSWSQAYNAGKLFAVISLQRNGGTQLEEQEHLNAIGKDLISTFESEFFTLEIKDLESIKQAISATFAKTQEGITPSFAMCYLADNVLFLYAVGGGKAVLKRGDKVGTVLEAEEGNPNLKSASGYVQEDDIIILETRPFQRIISTSILASALDAGSPSEISEALAPQVHERQEGGAASIVLRYKKGMMTEDVPPIFADQLPSDLEKEEVAVIEGAETLETLPSQEVAEEISTTPLEQPEITPITPIGDLSQEQTETFGENLPSSEVAPVDPSTMPDLSADFTPKRSRLSQGFSLRGIKLPQLLANLGHQRRIILTIGIVLVVLIAATAFLALNNQQNSANKTLFASVYGQAKTKYEEGVNLKDLNSGLARESFVSSKELLDKNKTKFKKGSDEEKQILSLLSQVNSELEGSPSSQDSKVEAKAASRSDSKLISYELNNTGASHFTQNDDKVFFLDGNGIASIDKGNDKKAQEVKKSWSSDGGIGTFGSNLYVLDKTDGILKFSPSGSASGYTKSSYFSSSPDLSNSVSMAIDGSVYVLFKDGSIQKYTRGAKDTFNLSNTKLSSPTRIFSNSDATNVYILDNGNSRIVVLGKDGSFKKAYSADILKNAKDFDVQEASKKILILSSGKIYQIDL